MDSFDHLTIRPYQPSYLVGSLDAIQYLHRAAKNKFLPLSQNWNVHE